MVKNPINPVRSNTKFSSTLFGVIVENYYSKFSSF